MFMLSFISVIVCDLFNFWLKANLFFFPHHLITSLLPLRIKFSKRERVYILLTGIYQTHWVCVPVRSKDPNHMLCIFVFRGLRRERWLLVLLIHVLLELMTTEKHIETISLCCQHQIKKGPGWFNELGSWIIYQLIQAYHQYGVGSHPAL